MNKTSSDISRKVPGISSMEVDEHDGVRVHDVFEMESVRSELPNNHEDHNSNPSVPTSWKDRLNSRAPREERKIGMQKLFGDIIRHNNRGPKFYLGPNGNKVWKRFKPKTERSQVICSHSLVFSD